MQAIMPMGLWRRAREAGRAWWAPEAGLPRNEVQDAPDEAQVVLTNGREESARGCGGGTLEQEAQDSEEAQLVAGEGRDKTALGCEESACRLLQDYQERVVRVAQAEKAALVTLCKKEKLHREALKIENKKMVGTANTLRSKLLKMKTSIDMGAPALPQLLPGGAEGAAPNFEQMLERWEPGLIRRIFMQRQRGASICARMLAAKGLMKGCRGIDDIEVIARGSFSVVFTGMSKIGKRKVAVKCASRGVESMVLKRELIAYAIVGNHENLINVLCMSDTRGGMRGLVMEVALCNLDSVVMGTSMVPFTLGQMISFEADATVALAFMHQIGIIHADHKLANILVCSSPDSPSGFVGKVCGLKMCHGIGEMRGAGIGTVSHAPPEGFDAEVAASPNHDTFAAGVDVATMLADPAVRASSANIWTHETLTTSDEKENISRLRSDGGDIGKFWRGVTHRIMTDGSFLRIMLKTSNLNKALPTAELQNVCDFIRDATSVTPADRPPMAAVTNFLRTLASSMEAQPAGPPDPPAEEGGDSGPAAPSAGSVAPGDRTPIAAVTEPPRMLTASTAVRSARPTDPVAVAGGTAGLAAETEPARLEELEEDGGVDIDMNEVRAMMRAAPLPFNSARVGGSGGGNTTGEGEEVTVPAVAPVSAPTFINAGGRLWTPGRSSGRGTTLLTPQWFGENNNVGEVVDMTKAVPVPFESPRLEGNGGGGITGGLGKVVAPAIGLQSTSIDVSGRLWTPRRIAGRAIPPLTPAQFC